MIDAGNGVCRQMALASLPPASLTAIFITHNHSDHVADYGTLLLRAWLSGLKTPVDTYGPSPIKEMTDDYLKYMQWDIQIRIKEEGRTQLRELIRAHPILNEGLIYQDDNVSVSAVEVPHGSAKPSYAFRFDTPQSSVVFSGDTSYSTSLINLAKGADILIHEVVNLDAIASVVNEIDEGNPQLYQHIVESHTSIEEVGAVATAADVHTLVLTHFVPGGHPQFDRPEVWVKGIRKHFKGNVIVGKDLLEIPVIPRQGLPAS
jgi:ribonuclease BN (tRNA processing enzyme)